MTAAKRASRHLSLKRAEQAAGLAFGFEDVGEVGRAGFSPMATSLFVAATTTGAVFAASLAWAL